MRRPGACDDETSRWIPMAEKKEYRRKIACVLGEDFEDSEFQVPVDALRGLGHEVVILGEEAGKELRGKRAKVTVHVDKTIGDVRPELFDALLIPGGYSRDHLRANPTVIEWVKAFDATGKPLAAVCHGPQLLMSAGLVKGRRLTAWKTVQVDLERMG